MARSQLLVAVIALVAASGCGQELPAEILLDKFQKEELAVVLEGIEEWNEVGKTYLGMDEMLNVIGGVRSDGFQSKDLQDGQHVIYRSWGDRWEKGVIDGYRGYETSGYGTLSDVVLGAEFFYPRDKAGKINGPLSRDYFRRHVLHEFGHFLGLLHSKNPKTVMHSQSLGGESDMRVTHLTKSDISQFCLIYDCVRQP